MFYTIYKITNTLNGKIYIGKHQTKKLDDDYMGSGKHINYAKSRYGLENFKKEILYVLNTEEEMNAKEKELVTEEFCLQENTYNICVGGHGGFSFINQHGLGKFKNYSDSAKNQVIESRKKTGKMKTPAMETARKINLKLGNKASLEKYPNGIWYGRKHKEETKTLMSKKAKERLQDPTKNSQFGTMWITDGNINNKINRDCTIPEGWYNGRTTK